MRTRNVVPAILATVLVAGQGQGLVDEFVIGPGTLGNPGADDPSVGYSSVTLDRKLNSPTETSPVVQLHNPPRPWLAHWYQLSEMPGV